MLQLTVSIFHSRYFVLFSCEYLIECSRIKATSRTTISPHRDWSCNVCFVLTWLGEEHLNRSFLLIGLQGYVSIRWAWRVCRWIFVTLIPSLSLGLSPVFLCSWWLSIVVCICGPFLCTPFPAPFQAENTLVHLLRLLYIKMLENAMLYV